MLGEAWALGAAWVVIAVMLVVGLWALDRLLDNQLKEDVEELGRRVAMAEFTLKTQDMLLRQLVALMRADAVAHAMGQPDDHGERQRGEAALRTAR